MKSLVISELEKSYIKELKKLTVTELREYLNSGTYRLLEKVRKNKNLIKWWIERHRAEVQEIASRSVDYYIEIIEREFGIKLTEKERQKIADENFLIRVELGLI